MRDKSPRNRRYEPVQSLLQATIGRMESADHIWQSLAIAYWPEVVGDRAAAASEANGIRDGVLFVRTKSSPWSQELSLLKSTIIPKLNKRIGRPAIKDIVFKTAGKWAAPEKHEVPTADEATLAAIIFTPDEVAALDERLSMLHEEIEDPERRTAIAKRLMRDAQLRHWRLQHGWKICRNCRGEFPEEGNLCGFCRLGI
jgi:predicted nucleic acid-binding Zn ribbon protein